MFNDNKNIINKNIINKNNDSYNIKKNTDTDTDTDTDTKIESENKIDDDSNFRIIDPKSDDPYVILKVVKTNKSDIYDLYTDYNFYDIAYIPTLEYRKILKLFVRKYLVFNVNIQLIIKNGFLKSESNVSY